MHYWHTEQTVFRNDYSQWTLLPGYKTSKRGERCAYGIPVILECTKQAGVFVHVSTGKQKESTAISSASLTLIPCLEQETDQNPNVIAKLEVNGSPQATIFYPIPFRAMNPHQDKVQKTLVYGGDIIKLVNRQTNSSICFETDKDTLFVTMASSELGEKRLDSSALWVIESELIAWGGRYCIF
jgi:hypothetical protein